MICSRKYRRELHANEIVLLAYYIAAINIEETFHGLMPQGADQRDGGQGTADEEYIPFDGICLTDTFQLYESTATLLEGTFPRKQARVKRQKAAPIRVVIANPPYSAQQEARTTTTRTWHTRTWMTAYGPRTPSASNAKLLKNLYDSYIRAIRWASDRIDEQGSRRHRHEWLIHRREQHGRPPSMPDDEFTCILRLSTCAGNQRTSAKLAAGRGKIFGSGAAHPIAITLLVKNPRQDRPVDEPTTTTLATTSAREEKLTIIRNFAASTASPRRNMDDARANAEHDWINQRDPAFENFPVLGNKETPNSVDTLRALTRLKNQP